MHIDRNKLHEFLRYCVVGTIAAGIHYGVYYLLQMVINVNIAYTSGYLVSFVCNFFMTSYLTFRTNPSVKKAAGFSIGHAFNYLLHMGLFNLYLFIGISKVLAPVLVLVVAVPVNFFVLRFVFRHRENTSA